MSANNQIQAENVSSLSLREASEKAVSALEGLLDHGKNAPWQAWEKALNANTFLRQALVAAEVDRHDATDDVEVIYLVWAFQGHGSWTDATKEQYEKAKHDDRMAVVSLDAYLSKEQRTRPQPQAVAQGWKPIDTAPKDGTVILVTDTFTYRIDPEKKPHHVYRAVRWNEEGYGWEIYNDGEIIDQDGPTFWMPLPAEPGAMLSASPAAPEAAKPEPQAQGEPEVVAIADGTFNCVAPLGMPLITLQSHREAMKQLLEANASYAGRERWWNDRMFELEQRLAKKDAALQACVAHMLIAYGQNSHDMILTGDELRGLHAAITKAEEARK